MKDCIIPGAAELKLLQQKIVDGSLPQVLQTAEQHKNDDTLAKDNSFSQKPFRCQSANKYRQIDFTDGEIIGQSNFSLIIDADFINNGGKVKLTNCYNFVISTSARINLEGDNRNYFLEIIACKDFSLKNVKAVHGRNSCLISDCSNFVIKDCSHIGGNGYGLIIHNSNLFSIICCKFTDMLAAGVMILGSSSNGIIKNCLVQGSRGIYNCDAGFHLCATSDKVKYDSIPEHCHEPLSITEKTARPTHITIEQCMVFDCRAQGIYLEGAVLCTLKNNLITGNNKEGICFDWGSSLNSLIDNTITLNGERKNMSEDEIKADFIADYPLLNDGSSSMKLPGVSIDNGACNLLQGNDIICNYGGGIKMVRSAFFNIITSNNIINNGQGDNRYSLFAGVTILGVGAINNEFTEYKNMLLDFHPSLNNRIKGNIIKQQWQAFYEDRASQGNLFDGNTIDETLLTDRLFSLFGKLRTKLFYYINKLRRQ